MRINELYTNINEEIDITGITTNAFSVKAGYIYVILQGEKYSNLEYLHVAIKNGASIVATKTGSNIYSPNVLVLYFDDVLLELKRLLNVFYKDLFKNIKLTGILDNYNSSSISMINTSFLENKYLSGHISSKGAYNPYLGGIYELSDNSLSNLYSLINEFNNDLITHITLDINNKIYLESNLKFDYLVFPTSISCFDKCNSFNDIYEYTKMVKESGFILVNKDNNYSKYFDNISNVIYYSLFVPSDYQVINVRFYLEYTIFDLKTKNQVYKNMMVNKTNLYEIYEVLPSIIISLFEKVSTEDIYSSLLSVPNSYGHLEKLPSIYPFDVYIDSSNRTYELYSLLNKLNDKNNLIIVSNKNNFKKSKEYIKFMSETSNLLEASSIDEAFSKAKKDDIVVCYRKDNKLLDYILTK